MAASDLSQTEIPQLQVKIIRKEEIIFGLFQRELAELLHQFSNSNEALRARVPAALLFFSI